MNTIKEIKAKLKSGKPLTHVEKKMLELYENEKKYRHSTSFIYHSRKLPEEPTDG